jgi:predicted membrane protein
MEDRQGITPGVVIGLLIVGAGTLWFLDQQGLVDAHRAFDFFWPAVLLVLGLTKLSCARRGGRVWGGLLTAIGIMLLLDRLGYVYFRWGQIWPLFVIAVGVMMVWGALERRRAGGPPKDTVADLNEFTAFGGGEIINDSKDFRGGEVFAMFGGYQVDLRDADIKGKEAVIHATAMFGGVEIRIPQTWTVSVRGTPFLGGFSDKTHHPKIENEADARRLVVTGMAVFGGVEVKN